MAPKRKCRSVKNKNKKTHLKKGKDLHFSKKNFFLLKLYLKKFNKN